MHPFSDMRNENIKFNAAPLLTKVNTKFTFESEIFKALRSFHNKINEKNNQQYLNFKNNSTTHITCTNNQKKLINNNIAKINKNYSTNQNSNTNQINKYNFKSSLISDILKNNSDKKKCPYKKSEENIVKRNTYNFPLKIYKTSFNNNAKNPNNLKIEINTNKINYFNTKSNNINEKKKSKIQKLKNEINKKNNNIKVVNNHINIHRIFKDHPNKINIMNKKNSVLNNYENNSCRKENKNKYNYNINIFNSNNNNYDICKNNDSKLENKVYTNICQNFIKYKQNKKKFLSVNNLNDKNCKCTISPNINRNKTKNIISSQINTNYINFYSLVNSEKNLNIKFNTINNEHSDKNNILKKIPFKTQISFYKPSIRDIIRDTKNNNNRNLDKNNLAKNPKYPKNNNSSDNKYLIKNKNKNNNSYNNNKLISQSNGKLTISNKKRNYFNNLILNSNDNNNFCDISNSDYKNKLSQIRYKTEGLLNVYYKLYKMISSDNIELKKNDV